MDWKVTDYLALWGACVATTVACWNIYRDFLKRERMEVSGGFRVLYGETGPGENCFMISIINHTDKPLRVTAVHGYQYGRWKRLFLAKIMRRKTVKAYLLPYTTLHGELPFTVPAKDRVDILYGHTPQQLPDVRQLLVTTADGREWPMRPRDMRAIRAEQAKEKANTAPSSGT